MSPAQKTKKPAAGAQARSKRSNGFTAEEKAAMQERAREIKAEKAPGRRGKNSQADGNAEVLERISKLAPADRAMAKRVHELVTTAAPELTPRTWYGMPAYAKDGKVVCYFQDAKKFKSRYATLGFSDKANLDDGAIWPVVYAVVELTPAVEKQITVRVKQAVS
jgi:uncharacterized protein YdhG (YjbR/CyaY superfamily)